MGSAGIPMLFLPTGPPLPLPGKGTIVIGRASDADLQLSEADTSRRHAKVICGAEGYRLHDLGSTNGTYVNGRRVEEHLLEAGDRIEIGDNLIAFCRVRTDVESCPDNSRATLFREKPAPSQTREAFRGDLAEIPPYAVLQILELGRKTGELSIDGDTTTGRLWLSQGDPVHAETKTQVGFDAALALVTVSAGSFKFEASLETPTTTIEANVTQLLLEASRVADEQNTS